MNMNTIHHLPYHIHIWPALGPTIRTPNAATQLTPAGDATHTSALYTPPECPGASEMCGYPCIFAVPQLNWTKELKRNTIWQIFGWLLASTEGGNKITGPRNNAEHILYILNLPASKMLLNDIWKAKSNNSGRVVGAC